VGLGPNKVLSAPDAIGQAIERYLEEKEGIQETLPLTVGVEGAHQTQASGGFAGDAMHLDTCPECNSAHFVFEEGCKKCHVCGYSECD
jgi:ribonucleoside-diphosphate reductase alpha chain